MSLIAFLCLQDVILCIKRWNPNFIQKIQWIVSVTLLKVKQAFFSTFAFNINLQVNHYINHIVWMVKAALFLLSMKFIVSAASYHAQCLHHNYDNYIFNNTDQMLCFCSLCVNAWAHNVQKNNAASDALNYIKICNLKPF